MIEGGRGPESELKRTVAQLDKAYTEACMDKRALEGRIEKLIAKNTELNNQVASSRIELVDFEAIMQAAERDLDRQDVEIAALKAANELLVSKNAEAEELYIAIRAQIEELSAANELVTSENVELRAHDSLYAENRRLRDVIVHQAAQLAGCGA
jgi:chromosome segregation ATPase